MSEKRRYTFKKLLGSLIWALMGLATVVLLGAAMSLRNNKQCQGVTINIIGTHDNFFIDKKEINNMLETICAGKLPGKSLSSFNLAAIENKLKQNQWIKKAELFFDNNEMLKVDVIEREPVARIFTITGSSFYLDSDLTTLPLSDKSSARVPVFSNFPGSQNLLSRSDSNLLIDVKNIAGYILKDAFWMAQIDQVDITAARSFEMIPKVGNQIIVFGNADNWEEKFNNLLTFYKQVAVKVGWNTYSKINVQYKGQVVAVKRGVEDILRDSLSTKQIMQNIVLTAQKLANDSIKNIQLVQLPDDNSAPEASQINDMPDEQTTTVNKKTVITPLADSIRAAAEISKPSHSKTVVPEKKVHNTDAKTFKPVPVKTGNVLKGPSSTNKLASKKKQKPQEKITVLKLSSNKPIIKAPTTTKIKIDRPKAVMPAKNDY